MRRSTLSIGGLNPIAFVIVFACLFAVVRRAAHEHWWGSIIDSEETLDLPPFSLIPDKLPDDWPTPRPTHEEWLSAADPHWAKRGIEEGEATELTLRNFRFDHGLRADGPYEADFFTPKSFAFSEEEERELAKELAGQEVVLVGHFEFGKRWVEFVVHEESPIFQGITMQRMAAAPFR